ncbi:MAG: FAD-binding protein [Ignavibacteria bacterium]|nr:FAD-binding protein [Ignavibacteria bacterium]
MPEVHETEVLVLGSGIAGGVAALLLAETGHHVTVATCNADPGESSTRYAQGGIVYKSADGSAESLMNDILRAGAGLSSPRAAEILATEGPRLVSEILIEKLGIQFEEGKGHELSVIREGGHSSDRIIHVGDSTGLAIETRLIEALRRYPNIALLPSHTAVDLLTPAHHSRQRLAIYNPLSCVGAYLLDQESGNVVRCVAQKTILATGGLGQIYLRTTNPPCARGDGIAMANRAGARVINAEFIQFHPTVFYKQNAPSFLISEAVRGQGGRLINARGEFFMERYDAEWKDLAPRDIVARSIHLELLAQKADHLFLDIASFMSADAIRKRFPSIHRECLKYGVDISTEPIPVVPGAHYFCGGVWVDEWGRTSVNNLYAVGEVSCTGLHGANRLASTSLLEGLVWASRASQDISSSITTVHTLNAADIPPWQDTGKEPPDTALISQDMSVIKHVMWNYVGLARSTRRLTRALHELRHLEFEIERFYQAVRLTDALIGLRNAVRAAIIVTSAAWQNKTSVGCHYRV